MRLAHPLAASIAGLCLASSVACYDSSWGQAKKSQQSVAQARTPQTLQATRDEDTPASALTRERIVRVRALATPRHVAETTDWQRRLADMLEDANRVLTPTLGARLVLAEARGFSPRTPDDSLAGVLDELAAADGGDDVDWVIGLTGSVPRFEESFHELGMARLSSKHLVLRAINDASELGAIEKGFPDLDAAERSKLFLSRKRHKRATVLLHEIGHTLGAPHQPDGKLIMTPRYGIAVESYGQAASELLRVTLEERLRPPSERDPRALAETSLAVLQQTADSWVPAEREEAIRRFEAQRGSSPRTAPAASGVATGGPPADARLTALTPAHRAAYDRAVAWQAQSRASEAWAEASPLFAAYPENIPVQELRCQLAMKLRDWSEAKKDCASLLPARKPRNGDGSSKK